MPMSRPPIEEVADQFRSVIDAGGEEICPWIDPGDAAEKLSVEDFPSFLFWRLANSIKTHLTKPYLDTFELTLPEWRVLGMVARYSPAPFGELVARSSMDKGQLSRTLRLIEKRGFVRTAAIPIERRGSRSRNAARMEVRITAKGTALCQRVVPVARQAQMQLLAMMEPEEKRVVLQVLRRMLKQLPDVNPPDPVS
jgi:DNA-binding MarR family transcriptional regulator